MQFNESKEAGQGASVQQPPRRKLAPVIDLMDALKKSIEQQQGQPAAASTKKPPQRATGTQEKPARRRRTG
jgi:DNA end-binding protein Ku